MEAVLRDERVRTAARTLAYTIAITITFAVLYWGISSINPGLAKSIGEPFGMSFKFANALRAFGFVFGPAAIIGTGIGAQAFNVTTGTAVIFGQSFMPIVVTLLGLIMLQISKWWGRAWWKDVILLATYGAVAGLFIALRLSGVAMMLAPDTYEPLLQGLILMKVISSAAIYVAGYPLVLAWEAIRRGKGRTT